MDKITLSITNKHGESLTMLIDDERDIFEYINYLRIMLKWITFPDSVIDSILPRDEDDCHEVLREKLEYAEQELHRFKGVLAKVSNKIDEPVECYRG